MIWNCLRNIKYGEQWFKIYLSLIFLVFNYLMGFLRKQRKICYISNFENFKVLDS